MYVVDNHKDHHGHNGHDEDLVDVGDGGHGQRTIAGAEPSSPRPSSLSSSPSLTSSV